MYKTTKNENVFYEGYFVSYKDYYEEQFEDDLVVRDYSVEKIIEKVTQLSNDEGILEIYRINMLNQGIDTIKIVHIFNELELINDF